MKDQPRIDKKQLFQMLREGKTHAQIAAHFKVSRSAVSHMVKSLKLATTKSVAIEHAHHVVEKELKAADQLYKINTKINDLLDQSTSDQKTIDRLAKAVEHLTGSKDKSSPQIVKRVVSDLMADRKTAIDCAAEIRQQLKLQLEIMQALWDVGQAREFQEEVLSVLDEFSPGARREVINKLEQRRAIRKGIVPPRGAFSAFRDQENTIEGEIIKEEV